MDVMNGMAMYNKHNNFRKSNDIAELITKTFDDVIISTQFPGSEIYIHIEVLQSDGGTGLMTMKLLQVRGWLLLMPRVWP